MITLDGITGNLGVFWFFESWNDEGSRMELLLVGFNDICFGNLWPLLGHFCIFFNHIGFCRSFINDMRLWLFLSWWWFPGFFRWRHHKSSGLKCLLWPNHIFLFQFLTNRRQNKSPRSRSFLLNFNLLFCSLLLNFNFFGWCLTFFRMFNHWSENLDRNFISFKLNNIGCRYV